MSDSPLYSTAQHSRMIKKKQNSRQPLTRSSHLTEVTTKYTHTHTHTDLSPQRTKKLRAKPSLSVPLRRQDLN